MSNIAHLQIHKRMRRKIGLTKHHHKATKYASSIHQTMQTQIAVFTVVVPLHLRGGALWCTFQWLVKENFCNWTQKQEKKTRVCAKHECTSCQEGSQNRLKRRVLQKRISAKDAAQTGLVQNIFSFPRATVDPNCNLRARLCFPGKRSNWGKKNPPHPEHLVKLSALFVSADFPALAHWIMFSLCCFISSTGLKFTRAEVVCGKISNFPQREFLMDLLFVWKLWAAAKKKKIRAVSRKLQKKRQKSG